MITVKKSYEVDYVEVKGDYLDLKINDKIYQLRDHNGHLEILLVNCDGSYTPKIAVLPKAGNNIVLKGIR
jgi:hypothetical protein